MRLFSLIRLFSLTCIFGTLSDQEVGFAQCSIPWRNICIDNVNICALADINGISCSSLTYSNVPACPTICGAPVNNIMYLAFLSQGGQVTVEMTVSNCSVNNTGLEMAISSNCGCSPIICQTSCNGPGVYSMTANLPACKYLFLMIDGCGGDICDFELNCTGPGAMRPELTSFSPIIGKQIVCEGACDENYSVQLTHGCGTVLRKWTLDGNAIGSNSNSVKVDFPDAGVFELCVEVSYYLISLQGTCAQTQQKCMQVTVLRNPDRYGATRYLCPETRPFLWYDQFIYDSDFYRSEFSTNGCCKYDSVVEFVYLDEPESPTIFHLACNPLDTFVDPTSGRSFNTCQNMQPVYLRKATQKYRCDSLYFLQAAFLDYKMDLSELCKDSLILSAQLRDQSDSCIMPWLDTDIAFKWYLGSDSLKKSLSADTFVRIGESGQYCLEMTARSQFGSKLYHCSYQYCQEVDLKKYIPDPVCPFGYSGGNPLFDNYAVDLAELPTDARKHRWRVEGGSIESPGQGNDSTSIWVQWDPGAREGKICHRYENSCFESDECCVTVRLISNGSEGNRKDWVRIAPNPFRDEFFVWLDPQADVRNLYVTDQLGRTIWQSSDLLNTGSNPKQISTASLCPGLYFLCAETKTGMQVQRLLKF